jgi:hypothetical protein
MNLQHHLNLLAHILLLVTNNINPSGVQVVPQPQSYTLTLSTPANSPNYSDMNSDKNSDGELLQIAGKSIFDHDKID